MTGKDRKETLRLIEKSLKIFPKVLKDKERAFKEKEKILKNFAPFARELFKYIQKQAEQKKNIEQKIHPWRICPIGEHWVRTHDLNMPSGATIRHGHCAKNPSKKDILLVDEINEIAQRNFDKLSGPPAAKNLRFSDGNKYDSFIRGWTMYWNDIFQPETPLDANLVKALIASESGFDLNPKSQKTRGSGYARGLIQLTDQAVKALGNSKGELKNHLVIFTKKDLNNPNVSICAGIRWLYQKQYLASAARLKRTATWEEAIAEYKGYLADMISKKNLKPIGMENLKKNYKELIEK